MQYKRINKGKVLVFAVFSLFIAYFFFTLLQQEIELRNLKKTKEIYLQEKEILEKEIDELKRIIQNANNDEYIEKQARERLKMVLEKEIVVIDMCNE